jgi:hypothetical protein
VELARNAGLPVLIMSNGMFLKDRRELLELDVMGWQITNDPQYYPQRVPVVDHPKVSQFDHIPGFITPLGRSAGKDAGRKSPMCFNLRSITRHLRDFREAVLTLRGMGKMCSPAICADGSIVAGESRFCTVIGTVDSSNLELTNKVAQMTCSRCGLVENLDLTHRQAVGEL